MVERRRCHRFNIGLSCTFELPTANGTTAVASTLDISATGLCLSTREKLEIGMEFPIQVKLPHAEAVTLRVEALWIQETQVLTTTEYKVGVKILEPVTEQEKAFIRFYAGKLFQFTKR